LAGFLAGVPSVGEAQTAAPSQVTPQSLRPRVDQQPQGVPLSGESALVPPAGAEDLSVLVGDIRVEGAFSGLEVATEALLREIRGKRVTVSQIYAVARAVERIHAQAGYPLARVIVPPQKLVDHGQLIYVVIDGLIEDIDVSALPQRVQSAVAARTKSLIGGPDIRLEEIERALLIAGETPGLKLRSTLMPGRARGGTRLVLEGVHDLLSVSIGGDNHLSDSLGAWQLRGTVAANSAFGAGEQVYATAGLSADLSAVEAGNAPLTLYGGGVVIPLGDDGLTLNPEYTHSITRTAAAPGVPATLGTFDRFALRLRDPVIRTRTSSLNVNASLEYISQQVGATAFNVLLNNDRYAVLRMGPDYSTALPWGATVQMGGSLSGGLGGRTDLDALLSRVPLSRLGASPDFIKANASLALSQPLTGALRLDVVGLGQLSLGKAMLRSEQFALDGSNAVSAFASGTINVDQGATLRGELVRSFAARADYASATISPYLFVAVGRGELFYPTAVEQSVINAGAVGLGTRGSILLGAGSPCLSFGLELARQFSDIQNMRQGWRGNVNASMEF